MLFLFDRQFVYVLFFSHGVTIQQKRNELSKTKSEININIPLVLAMMLTAYTSNSPVFNLSNANKSS